MEAVALGGCPTIPPTTTNRRGLWMRPQLTFNVVLTLLAPVRPFSRTADNRRTRLPIHKRHSPITGLRKPTKPRTLHA
eukprot:1806784-Pyramimonas_sp.AAC.1